MKTLLVTVLLLSLNYNSFAQVSWKKNQWKKHRKELFISIGASNFLGDLGGRNQIGKDYSPADMEFQLTQPSLSAGFRYALVQKVAYRAEFTYLKVSGSDALTNDVYRRNRNLSFKSNIFELSNKIEIGCYLGNNQNRFSIKQILKSINHKKLSQFIYGSFGAGIFWFNPKANYDNKWHSLKKLSTEGQGLPNGPKPYNRIAISIPLSIGYRVYVGKQITLGVEYCFRKTFTDYIDDVHGSYYDTNILKEYKGDIAVKLSDPNLGQIPGATAPSGDGNNAQRGDKENDSFMNLTFKIGWLIKEKKSHYKLRSKF